MILGIITILNIAICVIAVQLTGSKLAKTLTAAKAAQLAAQQAETSAQTAETFADASQSSAYACQFHTEDVKEQIKHVRACCTVKKI